MAQVVEHNDMENESGQAEGGGSFVALTRALDVEGKVQTAEEIVGISKCHSQIELHALDCNEHSNDGAGVDVPVLCTEGTSHVGNTVIT